MADRLARNNIQVILIQIQEAHSSAWPVGLENQPEPQKSFEERVSRAQSFVEEEKSPYPVYIDSWSDEFEKTFRAWPDKFYSVNKDLVVVAKAEYGKHADALIDMDYTEYLDSIMDK